MTKADQPPSYPAIRFIAKWGDLLAIAVGAVPACLGLWALFTDSGWLWLFAGAGTGALIWLVVRSYVEVLRILSDTLMPR